PSPGTSGPTTPSTRSGSTTGTGCSAASTTSPPAGTTWLRANRRVSSTPPSATTWPSPSGLLEADVLDDATVTMLERHWEDGWNGCDVEKIMEPFADDIVFTSPFVASITNDPAKATITGRDTLRSYVADSLRRVPDIRYTLDATYVGTESVVLLYTVHLP